MSPVNFNSINLQNYSQLLHAGASGGNPADVLPVLNLFNSLGNMGNETDAFQVFSAAFQDMGNLGSGSALDGYLTLNKAQPNHHQGKHRAKSRQNKHQNAQLKSMMMFLAMFKALISDNSKSVGAENPASYQVPSGVLPTTMGNSLVSGTQGMWNPSSSIGNGLTSAAKAVVEEMKRPIFDPATNSWKMQESFGLCLQGVTRALEKLGVAIPRMQSAHQANEYFETDGRFEKVEGVTRDQLANLPPGHIVVWEPWQQHQLMQNPQTGQMEYMNVGEHGHIAITDGTGRSFSDKSESMGFNAANNNAPFTVYKLSGT